MKISIYYKINVIKPARLEIETLPFPIPMHNWTIDFIF